MPLNRVTMVTLTVEPIARAKQSKYILSIKNNNKGIQYYFNRFFFSRLCHIVACFLDQQTRF